MFIEAVSFFIVLILAIVVAIPLSAMLVSLRAKLTGRYLNRYYIVNKKGNGLYTLHHQPFFGFYFARERKFFRFTDDAVRKFRAKYPDRTLSATTLTQLSNSRKGFQMNISGLFLTGARLFADFLILCNLANYRKVSGNWYFAKHIRSVHRNTPMRYLLVGE
jgi:hypothetical protein